MASPFHRVIVIVMDSVGAGALPDASAYGDTGSDTLGHIAAHTPLAVPTLRSLGLAHVAAIGGPAAGPGAGEGSPPRAGAATAGRG